MLIINALLLALFSCHFGQYRTTEPRCLLTISSNQHHSSTTARNTPRPFWSLFTFFTSTVNNCYTLSNKLPSTQPYHCLHVIKDWCKRIQTKCWKPLELIPGLRYCSSQPQVLARSIPNKQRLTVYVRYLSRHISTRSPRCQTRPLGPRQNHLRRHRQKPKAAENCHKSGLHQSQQQSGAGNLPGWTDDRAASPRQDDR